MKGNHSESIPIQRTLCLPQASLFCSVSALWNLKGCIQSKHGKTTDITTLYTGPEDEEQRLGLFLCGIIATNFLPLMQLQVTFTFLVY